MPSPSTDSRIAALPRPSVKRLTSASALGASVADPMERQDLMERPRQHPTTPQCTATSRQSGKRCRRDAIPGGSVCATHGGNAPQVRAKAEQRLAMLVNPALQTLAWAMDKKQRREQPGVAVRVAQDVLDRTGLRAPSGPWGSAVPIPRPGTSITQTMSVKVETLTNEELDTVERLLLKMGVAAPHGDAT